MAREDEPLAILPGLICDPTMFAELARHRPGTIVIGDYYGGASRLGDMADYALARLPAKFSLLGHSMGGRIALELWRRAPERVSRLILADTGVHGPTAAERDKRYVLRDLGRRDGFAALVEEWLPPMLGDRARGDKALVGALRRMCLRAGQAIFEAQTEALLDRPADVAALLPAMDCPVLAIVGREDQWSPVPQHREIAAMAPRGTLCVIEAAGHMLPVEDAPAMAAAISAWIAG